MINLNEEQFNHNFHGKQLPVSYRDENGRSVRTNIRSQAWYSHRRSNVLVHVDGSLKPRSFDELTIL